MRTKIVYIVSSNESDIYLEQTFLSIYSLRKWNQNAFVELVCDQDTESTIYGKRSAILQYIDLKTVVNVPDVYNKAQKSRWLKTSLRNHVKGDYLFIDSDTIIAGDLSSIDDFPCVIGAVPDGHVNMGKIPYNYNRLKSLSILDGWSYREDYPYYNSGVMFVKDTDAAYRLYDNWHSRWQKGIERKQHNSDQSYLAASDESLGYIIQTIDGKWNCQISRNGLPFLCDAKVIHLLGFGFYSQCPPWAFYDKSLYTEIKENGCISERISKLVDHAKSAFPENIVIVADEEADIVRSRLFRFLKRHKGLVSSIESISRSLIK